jgi:release factor glutamine methyltransferase
LSENVPARWTVLEMLRWMTGRFEERGMASARLDAELLIGHALSLSRVQVYTQFDRPLDTAELGRLRELVRRRQSGECVAYILGEKEFYGLTFKVDARVLVPRPDTETLVEEGLSRLRESAREQARILDVGTGSGALAIALAKQCPTAEVCAVDISPEALAVARANAERLGVRVTFFEGDLGAPVSTLALAPFDLIVANLPYIPTADLAGLAREVQAEPRLALDGGGDGLGLVRRLVAMLPAILAEGGTLALEIGKGQDEDTAALCHAAGLSEVRVRRDLGDVARVVSATRPRAETSPGLSQSSESDTTAATDASLGVPLVSSPSPSRLPAETGE